MNFFRTAINYLSFVFAGLTLLVAATAMQLWPASWWFEVDSVRVLDSQVGSPVVMVVNRTINRDFVGDWTASIRRLENGKWVPYCTATGSTNYQVDSELPDPLTLKWWTAPDCHPLEAGKYIMRTTWRINLTGFLPDKDVQATSNIFIVSP